MAKIKKMQLNNETVYPVTHIEAVYDSNGHTINEKMDSIDLNLQRCIKTIDFDGNIDINFTGNNANEIYMNVTDHGLIGDGVFDNTENMQNIINNLNDAENKYVLVFPPGIYNMTNVNISKSNITITGIGEVIIQTIKNTIHGLFTWDNNKIYSNIAIKNITFKGELFYKDQPIIANSIIYFQGVSNFIISNCNFIDCGGKAIIGTDGLVNNVMIDSCRFYNTVNGGIEIRPCRDIIVRNCVFKNIAGYSTEQAAHPIYFRADTPVEGSPHVLQNINIYNNLFEDIDTPLYGATYAIKVVVNTVATPDENIITDNVVIANNIINWKGGIYVSQADNCCIKNNVINVRNDTLDSRFIAILADKIINNTISDNEINMDTNVYSKCISLNSNTHCNITNNKISTKNGEILYVTDNFSKGVNSINMLYNNISSKGNAAENYSIILSTDMNTFKYINNIQECDIRCIHGGAFTIDNVFIINNTFIYIDNDISTGVAVRLSNVNILNKYQCNNTFVNFGISNNEEQDIVFSKGDE